MPGYKLHYFDVMGLGEPIRFLLNYGGAEFEDIRVKNKSEEWKNLKPLTPYGQVPIIEIDGKVYAQTMPICRYLAKQYNLLGKTDLDALMIDSIAQTLHDLRKKAADLNRQNDDALKNQMRNELLTNVLPFYLDLLEKLVKNNGGYFYGGELTYADIFFAAISDSLSGICGYDVLREHPNLKALRQKVYSIPAIKAWVEKRPKRDF